MTTNKIIYWSHYPIVVDPAVRVVEAKVGDTANPDADRWAPLYRVPMHDVKSMLGYVPDDAVHLFGRDPLAANNTSFLCYRASGLLVGVLYERGSDWVYTTVPDEIVGNVPALPSVRLTFKDNRGRQSFLYYIERVLKGQIANPTLQMLSEQLAEPIRILSVAAAEYADTPLEEVGDEG